MSHHVASRPVTPGVLTRFGVGDADAVLTVYREFGRLVFAVAHGTLGSRELAEEATQDTFVKAWRAAATLDPTRTIGPWLATIARRAAIDVHRRDAWRAASRLTDVAVDDPSVVELPPDIDRMVDIWEVRQAVDELPDDERDVVRLQHLDGRTQREVAQVLGLPLGTVKSRSLRAYRHLAGRLGHLREPAC